VGGDIPGARSETESEPIVAAVAHGISARLTDAERGVRGWHRKRRVVDGPGRKVGVTPVGKDGPLLEDRGERVRLHQSTPRRSKPEIAGLREGEVRLEVPVLGSDSVLGLGPGVDGLGRDELFEHALGVAFVIDQPGPAAVEPRVRGTARPPDLVPLGRREGGVALDWRERRLDQNIVAVDLGVFCGSDGPESRGRLSVR
jgi:hypothetical protein